MFLHLSFHKMFISILHSTTKVIFGKNVLNGNYLLNNPTGKFSSLPTSQISNHKFRDPLTVWVILFKKTLEKYCTSLICQATAMRFWVFAPFLAIFAKWVANGTKTTKTGHGDPVVFNQYIGQGAVTSDAIKKLDEKLDQLIKLLQPSPYAGNSRIFIFRSNTQMWLY